MKISNQLFGCERGDASGLLHGGHYYEHNQKTANSVHAGGSAHDGHGDYGAQIERGKFRRSTDSGLYFGFPLSTLSPRVTGA